MLGNGSVMGFDLFGAGFKPSIVMILPPGAFIALGFLMMGYKYVEEHKRVRRGGGE